MKIALNGEQREVPDHITVLDLLQVLNVQHQRVAVEVNENIVKKASYEATVLREGDTVEVVSFMRGGSSEFMVRSNGVQSTTYNARSGRHD